MLSKWVLGKVFISHSSRDKAFVRRLAKRLWGEGYQVWLDEKELVPGDALATRLSDALKESRVVIVVVTPNSLASKWLSFELNKATERMVEGQCRIIPVLKGDVEPPAELKSLIYADFRSSFAQGFKAILSALRRESEAAIRGSWAELESMVEEAFDFRGHGSLIGEYGDLDYTFVQVDGLMDVPGGQRLDDACIICDIVHDYLGKKELLGETWWEQYLTAQDNYPDTFRLVVSERPLGFGGVRRSGKSDLISSAIHSRDSYSNHLAIVLVDLSTVRSPEEKTRLIGIAREEICALASILGMPANPTPAADV